MANLTTILGAAAATLAAVFTGISLYLTGRREHNKWVRDALIDSYVTYLSVSFRSGSAAKKLVEVRKNNGSDRQRQELVKESRSCHQSLNDTLSRLRLLAGRNVVTAAESLRLIDFQLAEHAQHSTLPDEGDWRKLRSQATGSREAFIDAARRSMGLPAGSPISPLLLSNPSGSGKEH